ncbi:MAG TPA: hypothetical protein VG826_22155 [Pirellulales bacterium]|nr:hypothetical protein [Pirellulales bacterium]
MDQKSELTADVIAALDACRHDSNDHGLPEVVSVLADVPGERLAGYRRSIERIDRAVAGALHEVPLPSGLAERILAGVHARSSALDTVGQDAVGQDALGQEGLPSDEELLTRPTEAGKELDGTGTDLVVGRGAARWSTRRLVVAGSALTMAASLLVVLVWQATREKLDAGDLQARAKAFYEADDHTAPLTDARSSVVPVAPEAVLGWRAVTFMSRSGQAFELSSGRRRVKGTLYVIPRKSFWGPAFSGLSTDPLLQATSAMTVAVWADDNDVYVMVVKGDQTAFWSFFGQKFA